MTAVVFYMDSKARGSRGISEPHAGLGRREEEISPSLWVKLTQRDKRAQ